MEVHDEVLELFLDLDASESQLDSPFLYAIGRDGWVTTDPAVIGDGLSLLFDTITESIPHPNVDTEGSFQMLVSTLDHSNYVGRIGIGRIERGVVAVGDQVLLLPLGEPGKVSLGEGTKAKVTKIYGFEGLQKVEIENASAGDIIGIAGIDSVEIGKTISDLQNGERLMGIAVEEPTLSVDFMAFFRKIWTIYYYKTDKRKITEGT